MRVLQGTRIQRTVILIGTDHAIILLAFVAAAYSRGLLEQFGARVLWRASVVGCVLQTFLYLASHYGRSAVASRQGIPTAVLGALAATSLVLAPSYYWVPSLMIGPGVYLIAAILIFCALAAWRIAFDWMSIKLNPTERMLIVGTSASSVGLARELLARRVQLGIEFVGFVAVDDAIPGTQLPQSEILGGVRDIPTIVRERGVSRVVVNLGDARGKLPMEQLLRFKQNDRVRFDHLAAVYEEYTGKIALENLRPSWLLFSEGFRPRQSQLAVKRAFDLLVAATGLIACAPVMGVIALAVKLTSAGPILSAQRRLGLDDRPFMLFKFRSMRLEAEAITGPVWSIGRDPRVTTLGRIIRRTALDELPQLWNVLRGDMSLVGPRAERPEFVSSLAEQIPFYSQRHVVRPGITGWAQVSYSYGSSVEDAMEKLQYDLFYINNRSLSFDIYILLRTLVQRTYYHGS